MGSGLRAVVYERRGSWGWEWQLVRVWQNPEAGVPYRSFVTFDTEAEAVRVAEEWVQARLGGLGIA